MRPWLMWIAARAPWLLYVVFVMLWPAQILLSMIIAIPEAVQDLARTWRDLPEYIKRAKLERK